MDPAPKSPAQGVTPGSGSGETVWHDVAAIDDLPLDGAGRTFEIGKRAVAVFHVEDRLYAVSDTCPHEGASLGMGIVLAGELACPWHSFHFELRTGRNTDGLACRIQVYPVRRSAGGRVEVGLSH